MKELEITKKDLIKYYVEEKMKIIEIAKLFNCGRDTITRKLQKFNLKKGNTYKQPKEKVDEMKDIKEQMKQLYLSGKTCKEIGEIFNLAERTVNYHLHNLGVEIRSQQKIDFEKFKELWDEGKTDEEIAKYFGTAVTTIRTYRTRGEKAGKYNVTRYFSQESHELSEIQKQFIYGSLLGDMSISMRKRSKNARIGIIHCEKQEELFMKKVELLGEFMGNYKLYEGSFDKRTQKRYSTYKGNSKTHEEFTKIYKEFYPDGYKIITQEILNKINHPIALAYWFMDDGCKDGTIATNGFSEEEVDLLRSWLLEVWNINTSKHFCNNKFVIYIKMESRLHFEELIFPYMVKCMYYKLKFLYKLV